MLQVERTTHSERSRGICGEIEGSWHRHNSTSIHSLRRLTNLLGLRVKTTMIIYLRLNLKHFWLVHLCFPLLYSFVLFNTHYPGVFQYGRIDAVIISKFSVYHSNVSVPWSSVPLYYNVDLTKLCPLKCIWNRVLFVLLILLFDSGKIVRYTMLL